MVRGLAAAAERLDKTQGKTFYDFVALTAKESQKGQALGHIPSQRAAVFDKHYFCSLYEGGGLGCHQTGGATSHHKHIHLVPDGDMP